MHRCCWFHIICIQVYCFVSQHSKSSESRHHLVITICNSAVWANLRIARTAAATLLAIRAKTVRCGQAIKVHQMKLGTWVDGGLASQAGRVCSTLHVFFASTACSSVRGRALRRWLAGFWRCATGTDAGRAASHGRGRDIRLGLRAFGIFSCIFRQTTGFLAEFWFDMGLAMVSGVKDGIRTRFLSLKLTQASTVQF